MTEDKPTDDELEKRFRDASAKAELAVAEYTLYRRLGESCYPADGELADSVHAALEEDRFGVTDRLIEELKETCAGSRLSRHMHPVAPESGDRTIEDILPLLDTIKPRLREMLLRQNRRLLTEFAEVVSSLPAMERMRARLFLAGIRTDMPCAIEEFRRGLTPDQEQNVRALEKIHSYGPALLQAARAGDNSAANTPDHE